ncbi:MAG: hypothetical protein NUK65_01675 [Firmicutes bacterium]|nr:hypothetical protein [Bacillota bacterium]
MKQLFQPQEGDNIFNISQDGDFCCLAMQLFRAAGHTFNPKAVTFNESIRDFIYFDIQHDQVLTPTDWTCLNQVITASLLFSNGANYFDITNCRTEINYYAISLNSRSNERSQLAHEIHSIISRLSSPLSVILFEVNELYMFSFAERKPDQQTTVMLSDWFSLNSIIEADILLRIDASNFIHVSVIEFFYDFVYAIARPYYIYQDSYEYAAYEMFPLKLLDGNDGIVIDRETIKQIMQDNYNSSSQEYQEDYVAEDYNNQEASSLSTEDFDLELFALDMDTIEFDGEEAVIGNNTIEGELSYEEDDDYLDEVDEKLFDDPIKLLKWIEQHARKK